MEIDNHVYCKILGRTRTKSHNREGEEELTGSEMCAWEPCRGRRADLPGR